MGIFAVIDTNVLVSMLLNPIKPFVVRPEEMMRIIEERRKAGRG